MKKKHCSVCTFIIIKKPRLQFGCHNEQPINVRIWTCIYFQSGMIDGDIFPYTWKKKHCSVYTFIIIKKIRLQFGCHNEQPINVRIRKHCSPYGHIFIFNGLLSNNFSVIE